MQISNLPKLLPVPFASSGSKQDIPVASQIGVSGGRASYTDGFPPLTRTPIAAGGIPPFGTDFNGVLNDITSAIRWAQAGGGYRYDSTFSSSVGGYPLGAIVNNSTGDGRWFNTIDGNTNSPEVSVATPLTGWVPVDTYGSTTVSGLGSSSITLTTLQAAKDRLELSGTLTANINIIVPAWKKYWKVVNNCSGNFAVTVKTNAGTGVSVSTGIAADVYGDGVNVIPNYSAGSLINIQTFTSSGVYTPTPGSKFVIVRQQAAGGNGANAAATGNGQVACGHGGSAGAYAEFKVNISDITNFNFTVGVHAASSSSDTQGGSSSFCGVTCTGGSSGAFAPAVSASTPSQSKGRDGGTVTNAGTTPLLMLKAKKGAPGGTAVVTVLGNAVSGKGGDSEFSGGANSVGGGNSNGIDALSGAGGSGANGVSTPTGGFSGGLGGDGLIQFWEYA
ncbi:hypothetical protein [Atlantibacter hermannii]|uniref:hypothetical protein n=1 Tax=Atlantibacter hermannii TaxID=565 RepID=UPI0028AA7044|nr:hypothetical protein [Atlantibacter hermannii]